MDLQIMKPEHVQKDIKASFVQTAFLDITIFQVFVALNALLAAKLY